MSKNEKGNAKIIFKFAGPEKAKAMKAFVL